MLMLNLSDLIFPSALSDATFKWAAHRRYFNDASSSSPSSMIFYLNPNHLFKHDTIPAMIWLSKMCWDDLEILFSYLE